MRQVTRTLVNAVTDRQLGWMATLWRARWLEGTIYEISGWAYERGHDYAESPQVRVVLRRPGAEQVVEADVTPVHDVEINGTARDAEFDYANTGFVARMDLAPVLADPSTRAWQVHVEVTGPDGRTRRGTLNFRHQAGSAHILAARTFADATQLVPYWAPRRGLLLARTPRPVMAVSVGIERRTVEVGLALDGVVADRAELVSADARHPVGLAVADDGTARVRGEVPPRLLPQVYRIVVTDADGTKHVVGSQLPTGPVTVPDSGLVTYEDAGGHLCLRGGDAQLVVVDVTLEPGVEPRLRLDGTGGGDLEGVVVDLVGARQEIPVELSVHPDGTWIGTADLLQSRWGGPALLPRLGSYGLRARTVDGRAVPVLTALAVVARTPEKLDVPEARLRLEVGPDRGLLLRVAVTRGPDELGPFHQRRMDTAYREGVHPPERSVYLESFAGRLATCNPHAIDRVLAREHPGWTRYWGVTDLSVPVPEGAQPVVAGTQAWFDARARSRYVVVNDWLGRRFVPQPHQTVLQTWHGSMYKRIGLDRQDVRASTREAMQTERAKWDVLLSQNPESTRVFGSAYGWDGQVYEEGYPRNDLLLTGSGEEIRERLGVRPHQKAILYAPTWRDRGQDAAVLLDLDRLTTELGDDYLVLLRGHSRTVEQGGTVHHRGVLDVTTYPSITELFLAADAMITDYSSVMFDYSVTRRPMIFYLPDLDAYRDDARGVYFDLAEVAPGPVVRTQVEVVEAIRTMDDREPWAQRYASWRERFNALDDGHSAERVVRRLFADHPPGI
ncbi:MAG: hypothetical protein DCC50_04970 [Acidobacteria bacterium]|nr:MAG: hypothetical protein DCC50_04970 [Acidobacteriota bacterium]